jgi:hypothetical protein
MLHVEDYLFPHPAVVLMLPDRSSGRLSDSKYNDLSIHIHLDTYGAMYSFVIHMVMFIQSS